MIARKPIDDEINQVKTVIGSQKHVAKLTPLRSANSPDPMPILHTSVSCKWTIRSDRAHNTKTETLNLIRHRKGKTPHIVAVVAESLPTRIASIALGTGDIDCVYHFALAELDRAVQHCDFEAQMDMLATLIQGRRLRDISDLPFEFGHLTLAHRGIRHTINPPRIRTTGCRAAILAVETGKIPVLHPFTSRHSD